MGKIADEARRGVPKTEDKTGAEQACILVRGDSPVDASNGWGHE
jgi:hypothetical protein